MTKNKLTARERIETLLDRGTFVEMDKHVVHRCNDFGMEQKRIEGDGVISGYGKIDGRIVFVYAFDFAVLGGSLSAANAQKIAKVQDLALYPEDIAGRFYPQDVSSSATGSNCDPHIMVFGQIVGSYLIEN